MCVRRCVPADTSCSRPVTRTTRLGNSGTVRRRYRVTEIDGVGAVESWVELTDVSGPLVSFRGTWVFASDGEVLTSDSTLRFRDTEEVRAGLVAQGYLVDDVRDAPDRPGRELVFFARRTV